MSRFGLGLIVGKFRPPHRGHDLLIETGLAQCDRLVVVVCDDERDDLSADLRASWLRELHPSAEIRVEVTSGVPDLDSRIWARLARNWLGQAPDAVFTSEPYGDGWAVELGCAHVSVDPDRVQFPIAASAILAHPLRHLAFLRPPVRGYFIPRAVLVGAESTGKTTLAKELANQLQTAWVPEYGRTVWEGILALPRFHPTREDFIHIARTQQAMEEQLAQHAERVLICDTDAFATALWAERYLGAYDEGVAALAEGRRSELYLLTGAEIPWVDDGTRERKEERRRFQTRFEEELARQNKATVHIAGDGETRVAQARAHIAQLVDRAM